MKPAEPKGWSESTWCIHLWFNGQETAVQVKRELPHQHISRYGSTDVFWRGNWTLALEENVIVDLLLMRTLMSESVPSIWQGIFYEIDSKNQSCVKKTLHCTIHPLDIPDGAKFHSTITAGSSSIEGEGLKVNVWFGSMPGSKGKKDVIK